MCRFILFLVSDGPFDSPIMEASVLTCCCLHAQVLWRDYARIYGVSFLRKLSTYVVEPTLANSKADKVLSISSHVDLRSERITRAQKPLPEFGPISSEIGASALLSVVLVFTGETCHCRHNDRQLPVGGPLLSRSLCIQEYLLSHVSGNVSGGFCGVPRSEMKVLDGFLFASTEIAGCSTSIIKESMVAPAHRRLCLWLLLPRDMNAVDRFNRRRTWWIASRTSRRETRFSTSEGRTMA